MSKVQTVRVLIKQRLISAAEEIFEIFEKTILEYEEKLCQSSEEKKRQEKLLDSLLNPQLQLHRAACPAYVQQQQSLRKQVSPEQQKWNSSLDQQDPTKPEPPHIKEEEEEVWNSQEGEQLQGLEEADTSKFSFTPVCVKSEDDEEEPQSSPGPLGEFKTEDFSETETEESNECRETKEHQSGFKKVPEDERPEMGPKSHSCSECEQTFTRRLNLTRHMKIHTVEKPFSCSECRHFFYQKVNLNKHMIIHTREKLYDCPDCGKSLKTKENLMAHLRVHSGEKPFSCSECDAKFRTKKNLAQHMVVHTDEKPFHCSVCGKAYKQNSTLKFHMALHTGEKPFSCSVCDQRFSWPSQLRIHKCVGGQGSECHQNYNSDPGAEGEDCRRPVLAKSSDQEMFSQAEIEVKIEDFSDPETEVRDKDCKETRGNPFGLDLSMKDLLPLCQISMSPVEKPYICPICGKRLGYSGHLKTHMRTHTGEKPFGCSLCGKRFTQKCSLKQHMVLHTGEKPFSCSVCGQRFAWRSQIKRHDCVGNQASELHQNQLKIAAEPGGNGQSCGGPERARSSDVKKHVRPETQVKTDDCSELETDVEDVKRGNQADPIKEVFVKPKETQRTDKKRFNCSTCNKKFSRQRNLNKHMRSHTGEKPFHCSVCDKKFAYKETLVRHSKFHTDEKPFTCPVCSKNFSRKENFARHMRFHSGEKPYSCSFCHKQFTRKEHAVTHMRIHTGEKPYSCSVCGKRTGCKTSLRVHMRTHTGEKPFKCSFCYRKFTQSGSLTEHMALHTGEKSYDCPQCGKRMGCKSSLKVHMRTHTGEKPFSCSVCGKKFTQKGNLKEHMAIHQKEKPFSCKVQTLELQDSKLKKTESNVSKELHSALNSNSVEK
ncbi:zinc finger protein OZF-like isoform X1 [Xyrichtys novacula]|uniref:Zinc finger protein OZF-like isoform X1 n=1 Tax=Xyrichtys novacula TaxID=13765 RepID=A0AAV1HF90_XYRNO|nr:zinc finger protein OZF-like isoform X1 [Xyrichtys novacula]